MASARVWLWSGARVGAVLLWGVTLAGGRLAAQAAAPMPAPAARQAIWPDAPSARASEPAGQSGGSSPVREAPPRKRAGRFDPMIEPGELPPRLSVPDKFVLGLRAAISPLAVTGWIATTSVGYARDAAPMYGQTGAGFAQRFAASAAKSASSTVMTDSVMAALLGEDPRYYKMGVGHSVGRRTGYALSRVFVTRTDGGRRTPNFALLIGNVASASMTQFYYPPINRGVGSVAGTYGRSLIGAAVGCYVREFVGKWLVVLHLRTEYT